MKSEVTTFWWLRWLAELKERMKWVWLRLRNRVCDSRSELDQLEIA